MPKENKHCCYIPVQNLLYLTCADGLSQRLVSSHVVFSSL